MRLAQGRDAKPGGLILFLAFVIDPRFVDRQAETGDRHAGGCVAQLRVVA
jgi:hypothetical protein